MTRVLCVGLTTLDVVHHLAGPPRWGTKHRSVGGELVAGGPAANAAVTAARLLGSARLLTAVGDSALAAAVHADLAAHRVEVSDLAPPGAPVRVAGAAVDVRTGDRTVFGSAIPPPAVAEPPGRALDEVLDGVTGVLLDGYLPVVARAVAVTGRVPVVLDAGSWKDDAVQLLPLVTVAACSADLRPPGAPRAGDDPLAVAAVLHGHGVPTVLVTDGPRPVTWSRAGGGHGVLPVPEVAAVDTLGAGDAFHGALVAALALGLPAVPDAAGCAAEVAAAVPDAAGCAAEVAIEVAAVRCSHLGARGWLTDPALDRVVERLGAAR